MSNEKFTPGPWFVDHGVPGKPRVFSESDVLKKMICACEHGAKSRQDYDAALIAAAPEMYELLEKVKEWLERNANNMIYYNPPSAINMREAAVEIEQVLKKARRQK